MSSVDQAIDLEQFFLAAQAKAVEISQHLPVSCVLLDNWHPRGARNVRGARLIYDTNEVAACNNVCGTCRLFHAVGTDDPPNPEPVLRSALCAASAEQRALFDGKQRHLNCKTLDQFEQVFVIWCLEKCPTQAEFWAELDLANQFRVLIYEGQTDLHFLVQVERQSHQNIRDALRRQLLKRRDTTRLLWLEQWERELGRPAQVSVSQ